jgi:hypothetical protein
MKRISMTMVTVLGLAISGSAFAYSPVERQRNQQERIDEGVRSGELNRREAARLEREHLRLGRDIRLARRDGLMTRAERGRIEREQDRFSRHIYREKHDGQFR